MKMKISQEKISQWAELLEYGDIKAISKESGFSTVTISKAINHKTASSNVIMKINEYFDNKRKRLTVLNK